MPISILLDVSLSMLAPFSDRSNSNRRSSAISGVSTFLDHLLTHNRQEYVSLAAFSEDLDPTDFTKDYALLKENLLKTGGSYETRAKSNLVDTLRGAFDRCVAWWGSNVLCHVVLITDCAGYSPDFERMIDALAVLEGKEPVERMDVWKFRSSSTTTDRDHSSPIAREFHHLIRRGTFTFHVIGVNSPSSQDRLIQQNVRFYKKLIEFFDHGGSFRFVAEEGFTTTTTFRTLAEELSANSSSILKCGSLDSPIDIVPALKPIKKENDFDVITAKLGDAICIVGFLRPTEIGSPPVTSRHLILASRRNTNGENVDPIKSKSLDDERSPNFCVLLHGAMKVEDMVAICEIGANWYGYIYHLPSSKKSNLILHCFEPGTDAIPWLGLLNRISLRPFPIIPGTQAAKSPFPVSLKSKPSYSLTVPNWIRSYGLQADVQKVLRYARKLPEKEGQFHQELGRVCNQAMSLGFMDLLTIMARLLEKELTTIGANGPQAPGLKHAINILLSGRLKFGDSVSQFGK